MFLLGYLFDSILDKYNSINAVRIVNDFFFKNLQLLDIVECVETCKLGLVLLVGGRFDRRGTK